MSLTIAYAAEPSDNEVPSDHKGSSNKDRAEQPTFQHDPYNEWDDMTRAAAQIYEYHTPQHKTFIKWLSYYPKSVLGY